MSRALTRKPPCLGTVVWIAGILGVLAGASGGRSLGEDLPTPRIVSLGADFAPPTVGLHFSPDGRRLATAVGDKTVRVWDLETKTIERILLGYSGRGDDGDITAVRFSPDGRELVVAAAEPGGFALRIYNTAELPERDRLARCLHQVGSKVFYLAFSDDGAYLVTAGNDGDTRIWDWPQRRVLHSANVEPPVSQASFAKGLPIALIHGGRGISRLSAIHGKRAQDLNPVELGQIPGGLDAIQRLEADLVDQLALTRSIPPEWGSIDFQRADFPHKTSVVGGHTNEVRPRYWAALRSGATFTSVAPDVPRYYVMAMDDHPGLGLVAYSDESGRVVVWKVQENRTLLATRPRSVYTVAFRGDGRQVVFGHKPDLTLWANNHYGVPESTFDLETARVVPGVAPGSPTGPPSRLSLGPDRLTNGLAGPSDVRVSDSLRIQRVGNPRENRDYPVALHGRKLWCFGLLNPGTLGIPRPVIAGTHLGSLFSLDPDTGMRPREFLGHRGPVSAFDISPKGNLLVSSSLDGTVKFWSLQGVERKAFVDFDDDGFDGIVVFVTPGGQAERAGVRLGDKWLELDGKPLTEIRADFLEGKAPYKPGQTLPAKFQRGGREYTISLPLVAYGDVVDPLLTLQVDQEGEWVAWTPEGFYSASLQGDRLIGFRINRSRDEAAAFHESQEMSGTLHQPEIVQEVLRTGKPARTTNRGVWRPDGPPIVNPADPAIFDEFKPPEIRLRDLPGTSTKPTVDVTVELSGHLSDHQVVVMVQGEGEVWGGYREYAGTERSQPGSVTLQIELSPGRNLVSAKALSRSESASNGFSPGHEVITYKPKVSPPLPPRPRVYLLAFGVQRFLDGAYPPLDFPEKDARDFVDLWRVQAGGPLYESVTPKLLRGREVTARAIRTAVEEFVIQIQKDREDDPRRRSILVVFASTHGVSTPRGLSRYFLLPHDAKADDLPNTAIPSSFWLEVKRGLESPFYLFLDSCRSGAVVLELDRSLRELTSRSSPVLVYAATPPGVPAREQKTRGNGLFTGVFLEVAKNSLSDDDPRDAYLSAGELGRHLTRLMKERSGNSQIPVVPRKEFDRMRLLGFIETK